MKLLKKNIKSCISSVMDPRSLRSLLEGRLVLLTID